MKRTTMAVFAALGLTVAGLGAATLFSQASTEASAPSLAKMQIASFEVENMTCATCPITVRRAMQGVDGVSDVTIDFEAKTATARFDPAQTTVETIAAASADAGYPARAQSIAAGL